MIRSSPTTLPCQPNHRHWTLQKLDDRKRNSSIRTAYSREGSHTKLIFKCSNVAHNQTFYSKCLQGAYEWCVENVVSLFFKLPSSSLDHGDSNSNGGSSDTSERESKALCSAALCILSILSIGARRTIGLKERFVGTEIDLAVGLVLEGQIVVQGDGGQILSKVQLVRCRGLGVIFGKDVGDLLVALCAERGGVGDTLGGDHGGHVLKVTVQVILVLVVVGELTTSNHLVNRLDHTVGTGRRVRQADSFPLGGREVPIFNGTNKLHKQKQLGKYRAVWRGNVININSLCVSNGREKNKIARYKNKFIQTTFPPRDGAITQKTY